MENGLGNTMKTITLILVCCLSTIVSNKPTFMPEKAINLKLEVHSLCEDYIAQIKGECSDFITGLRVYVFYAYDKDSIKNEFCFTLGYILEANSYKYYDDDISYYMEIEGEYILLKMKEEDADFADQLGFKSLDHFSLIKILQKLHPPIPGSGFTGIQKPMAGCVSNDSIFFNMYWQYELPERFRHISH